MNAAEKNSSRTRRIKETIELAAAVASFAYTLIKLIKILR